LALNRNDWIKQKTLTLDTKKLRGKRSHVTAMGCRLCLFSQNLTLIDIRVVEPESLKLGILSFKHLCN
jgi:hypothetical protein